MSVGTAHQRVIRDRMRERTPDGLFGAYWEDADTDISNAVVRAIDYDTAQSLILDYEWLGSMPAFVWFSFGVYFDGLLAGAVTYGPEYSENIPGVWDRFGYIGKLILLSRGACVHWAHPHSGSLLIRRSMDMLPAKYQVVTATVDPAAGEIGTIYQACGFDYIGAMMDKADPRYWLVDGKVIGSRVMRDRIGTSSMSKVARLLPHSKPVMQHPKGRYFAFRGSRTAKRHNRVAIRDRIKPYPKR